MSSENQQIMEENRRLKRAVDELSILNDLARTIAGLRDTPKIMDTIVRRSIIAVHAQQGVITLVDNKELETRTLIRATASSSQHEKFHINQTLIGWMHINRKPLIINDPSSDERFRGVKWDESIRSLLCVPMLVKSELIVQL